MLAYVFSHRPGTGVQVSGYEDVLREFHAQLASTRPRGFVSSLTYRVGDAYSDWYLLEDSTAMDALNEAAVSGSRANAHDAAARMAVDSVGKLLSLTAGTHDVAAACEMRFAKPSGMAYSDLYASLHQVIAAQGTGLWRRMMVLGPPPEFCLTAPAPLELPPSLRSVIVNRVAI